MSTAKYMSHVDICHRRTTVIYKVICYVRDYVIQSTTWFQQVPLAPAALPAAAVVTAGSAANAFQS